MVFLHLASYLVFVVWVIFSSADRIDFVYADKGPDVTMASSGLLFCAFNSSER